MPVSPTIAWICEPWLGNPVTTTNKSLFKEITKILKNYYPEATQRTEILEYIIPRFEKEGYYRYPLDEFTSLILLKDQRAINSSKRFEASPFPYLTNVEYFKNTVGEWNQDLQHFGIKTRSKWKEVDHLPSICGSHIHLALSNTPSSRGNKYLKKQYKLLSNYRQHSAISEYWNTSFTLMKMSWSFKLACLNSWSPGWYKELSFLELGSLFKGLHTALSLSSLQTTITNVWIESPKNKWRQLGIPPKSWRLYFHMLNMFLTYIYEPHLPPEIYDGFIYDRGCQSWWKTVLWSPLLNALNWIIEIDFSSGFPNLHLSFVRKALISDGLLPPSVVNLILHHLLSPQRSSSSFPTLATFIEHHANLPWRESKRNVPMGLGISPILFVITLHWCLNQLHLQTPNFTYKFYADDGSLYFNLKGLVELYSKLQLNFLDLLTTLYTKENPLLVKLNQHWLFTGAGLKVCLQKSSLVRLSGIWLKPYRSLGLSLYTPLSKLQQIINLLTNQEIPLEIQGYTRGRGANPSKGTTSTAPSRTLLSYRSLHSSEILNLASLVSKYEKYFGLLMSKLYSSHSSQLSIGPTLLNTCKKGSILHSLLRSGINKNLGPYEKFTLYNSSSKSLNLFLSLIKGESYHKAVSLFYPNLERELKPRWKRLKPEKLIKEECISNPLENCSEIASEENSFKKYSELKLTRAELIKYEEEYNRTKL